MVQTGYVEVRSVPTRVVTCGGWMQEAFVDQKDLVLIITGNPGLTAYYEEFIEMLHNDVKMPVWAVCHAGHEFEDKIPCPKANPDLYNLEGQIEHKVEFIKRYVPPEVKIHLIGHSVGSYIILKMLKNKMLSHHVHMNYLLFPAIERIGASPNGKFFTFMNNYFHWIIVLLASFVTMLPTPIGRGLVRGWFLIDGTHPKNVTATMQLLRPQILKNIFSLAADEMESILELDVETVDQHKDKLRFYYGQIDGWCPLTYYDNLKENVPDARAHACTNGYRHAFVLNYSRPMADIVSKWIKEHKM
ncbi:lipid droplet-associated hydrolase [Neocloeon triangulifer]|uniref:lipid droplet-associated hydrolase n=1 Tax=Neocloeon triangulifer TaxID=2078957 RepID=UPI00286F9324|nr:lipid droplet-associated hydrolase [Neocloeon triangulifer]XP_059470690.1 lipid droplet-associated hydrolase [Neocloeon triangulifer]XP_059470691.1 lipid droplet-associated hydrolase [Neocloeon triangulifer]XP_059470692.1 lipid droplet-associated hydrolase [Neocloeon triangulifer]XP_059470693.1 lipid droplet-associated hydrolase [Neocloeon triangulifer]